MTKEKAVDNVDKLIVHGLVVTVDDDEKLIEDGAIAISGTDIVAIGPFRELSPIIIDLNRPHLVPLYDVYSHLVYAVGRDDVSTVLINGQVVMRNRQLLTIDEGATMAEVRMMAQQIAEAILA